MQDGSNTVNPSIGNMNLASQESLVLFDKNFDRAEKSKNSPVELNAELGKQQSQVVLMSGLKDSQNKGKTI